VIGKFRQERDVPMQPDARTALEEQLDEGAKLWTQNPQRLREVMAEDGDIYKLSKILALDDCRHRSALRAPAKEDLVGASQQVKIPVRHMGGHKSGHTKFQRCKLFGRRHFRTYAQLALGAGAGSNPAATN